MSVTVAEWKRCWRAAELDRKYETDNGRAVGASAVKHVLLALSTWADYDTGGNARPGVELLVGATSLSPQVVRWALQVGRRLGWVERTASRPGSSFADVYALRLPAEWGDSVTSVRANFANSAH